MNIVIEEDKFQEMLYIDLFTCGEKIPLFFGNHGDFDVSGNTFKQLFEKLNIETNLIQIEESE
jgi:hypothetical protein